MPDKKYIAEVKKDWKSDNDKDLIHFRSSVGRDEEDNRTVVVAVWNPRMHAYVILRNGGMYDRDRCIDALDLYSMNIVEERNTA